MRVRLLGLGNPLLADDAAGLAAVGLARGRADGLGAEVALAEAGGLGLMDCLSGCDACVVVDAVSTGAPAGTLHRFTPETLPFGRRLRGAHDADLASALGLGRGLGLDVPHRVRILGIEAADLSTFGGALSPAVEAALAGAAEAALDMLNAAIRGDEDDSINRTKED